VDPLTAGASAGIEVNAAATMTAAMINATAAVARAPPRKLFAPSKRFSLLSFKAFAHVSNE